MHPNILIPVDFQGNHFDLSKLDHLFEQVPGKRFTGFFLSDFVEPVKNGHSSAGERLELQHEINAAARQTNVDFQFMIPSKEDFAVVHQSRFADLALLGPVNGSAKRWPQGSMVNFFSQLACPVMLVHEAEKPFQDILVYLDYDVNSLVALKAFLAFFGNRARGRNLTILASSPDDEPGIFFEKCLVQYLQKEFRSVGVVPINDKHREVQLLEFAGKLDNPLIIMGTAGKELLKKTSLSDRILDNRIALLYAN
jgi:hypothetical protein